jgi:hypothetical protein
LNFGGSL